MDIIINTIFITILAAGIFLAFWVLSANPKSNVNRLFFGATICVLAWNIFSYLANHSTENAALFYFRLNYAAVALHFIPFYFLSLSFPVPSKYNNKLLNYSVIILAVFFAASAVISPSMIEKVTLDGSGALAFKAGTIGTFFYVYSFVVAVYVIFILIKKFLTLNQIDKIRTSFLLVGIFSFALMNVIFNIIVLSFFPTYGKLTQLGDFSAILLVGFSAYAIMKHHLFNIKVIATETAVIVLSLVLFIQIFISNSFPESSINFIIWSLATYGGWQLIKSVKREIQQRERLAKLTKELEKANEHLKEVDKLKDDFLSMASHELNTPIAAIEGYLSMILVEKMAGEIPPKAKEYLNSVFKSSQRLANMVKDLLNVSRIESNRIHLIYEDRPIEDIIKQAVMEVMSKAREAHHTLSFDEPKKQMPKTWFDVTRITEILINIIGNAIKYTDPGGKITVRVTNDEQKIVVAIEDNGRGIPKDRQKSVFEKFSQVDVLKDQVKGTGLGMYISQKFIELHKGKIWFHSDGEGKGTTFYFSLPILDKKPFDPHEGEGSVLH